MQRRKLARRAVIVLAVGFLLSVWLYCLATMQAMRAVDDPAAAAMSSSLLVFFREHGTVVLGAELVLLAVGAVVMVATDRTLEEDHQDNKASAEHDNDRDDQDR